MKREIAYTYRVVDFVNIFRACFASGMALWL